MVSIFAQILPSWTRVIHPGWIALASISTTLLAVYLYLWVYLEYKATYKNLKGPKPHHWFWGSLPRIFKAEPGVIHTEWTEEYGHTYRYKMFAGGLRICTSDPVAMSYILQHSDILPKPSMTRSTLVNMLGNGVLVAEGDVHRRQRKVLNPCFSPQNLRENMLVFYDKAEELKDLLLSVIEDDPKGTASPSPPTPEEISPGGRKIDIMKFLAKCTIDVIGVAGFGYDFKALSQSENELAKAFGDMFQAGQGMSPLAIFQALVPYANLIPTKRSRTTWAAKATTQRIGRKLIEEKKRAIQGTHSGGLEKGHEIGKDLLSQCMRANMAGDLKPEQRLTDDEVLAQITTFMLAGNETSSTNLTWILYEMSIHPDMQDRLRKECQSLDTDRPTLEELNGLSYMDAVIRETLRLLPPVNGTIREAAQDFVLPFGTPLEGRDGQMMQSVNINKGATIFVPIYTMNTKISIWGPDATEFNPDRFLTSPGEKYEKERNAIPGVWGNLMSFLGGTRSCIGYRFALAEIKVILFILIRNFTFEELGSKPKIEKKSAIVMRPRVIGEENAGLQLPLMIKPLSHKEE